MKKNLNKVKWKTEKCSDNDCWCRLVVPVHPITDEDGNVWDAIFDAGTIGEELAEYIVGLHNCRLDQITTLEEYLKPELEKYIDFPKLLGVVDPSYVGMAKRNLSKPKPPKYNTFIDGTYYWVQVKDGGEREIGKLNTMCGRGGYYFEMVDSLTNAQFSGVHDFQLITKPTHSRRPESLPLSNKVEEFASEHKDWLRMLNERMGIPSKYFGKK